jgi:hypothetical protein
VRLAWKVLEKRMDALKGKDAGKGLHFVLVCERDGRRRDAIVGIADWAETPVGGEVMLREETTTLPRCLA